ncbi:hypothetical protein EIN_388200, partial [Entamoeba invadens IP1]
MEKGEDFSIRLEAGQDNEVVNIHLKVTRTLLLFDETFRGMKAYADIVCVGDEKLFKESKDRLREFQIILKKVGDLQGLMESFEGKSSSENRIIRNLLLVWSKYNKEYVLKAISFANEFSKEIEKEEKESPELTKHTQQEFTVTKIENTVINANGGVLILEVNNFDFGMKVFVNGNLVQPTVKKTKLFIQVPKQVGEKRTIQVVVQTPSGNCELKDLIFYDKKLNASTSHTNDMPQSVKSVDKT